MIRRYLGVGLALVLAPDHAFAEEFPVDLPPPPPPPAAPAARTPAPVAPAHWSQALLTKLRFSAAQAAPQLASRSRLDAAIHLARWLERGAPTPEARPRLLAAEYAADLRTLGVAPEQVEAALERLEPPAPVLSRSLERAPHGDRSLRLVEDSLSELRSIEARLLRLQAQRR